MAKLKNIIAVVSILFILINIMSACQNNNDNNNNNDDDTPGIDEFFSIKIDGNDWIVDNDSTVGCVLTNYGSGTVINIAATRASDSSFFQINIPYFYATDTTFDVTSTNVTIQNFYGNATTQDVSGTIHIQKSTSGSFQVFEGDISYTGQKYPSNVTVNYTNGSFRVARML